MPRSSVFDIALRKITAEVATIRQKLLRRAREVETEKEKGKNERERERGRSRA